MVKAVGLFSGGLDSLLAQRLIQNQGIDVHTISFVSAFFGNPARLQAQADRYGFNLTIVDITEDYMDVVKNPRFGYGKNMNPCIDCKIFMISKAAKWAEEIGARFVFTGEVLGQRPMSQLRNSLNCIEKNTGLKGKLLRPLCAKRMEPTEAEINGWVDREQLLDFHGRGRDQQMALAAEWGIDDYASPAGGCLLTFSNYVEKLRDLLAHDPNPSVTDLRLLKVGRHFRIGESRILVGKNLSDNQKLRELAEPGDAILRVDSVSSPSTLIRGPINAEVLQFAAMATARYSDSDALPVAVSCRQNETESAIMVHEIQPSEIDKVRVNQ